jgi:hypothetical protein
MRAHLPSRDMNGRSVAALALCRHGTLLAIHSSLRYLVRPRDGHDSNLLQPPAAAQGLIGPRLGARSPLEGNLPSCDCHCLELAMLSAAQKGGSSPHCLASRPLPSVRRARSELEATICALRLASCICCLSPVDSPHDGSTLRRHVAMLVHDCDTT